MLKGQTTESLINRLQAYRQNAEANRNFTKARDNGERRKPYFRHYPPEVQTVCWEFYNSLYAKYSYKLKDDPSYVRILVATATRLALEKLGLRQVAKKGFHRIRHTNWILQQLGIRDKREDQIANNRARGRKNAKATADPPCGISQGSLEGI